MSKIASFAQLISRRNNNRVIQRLVAPRSTLFAPNFRAYHAQFPVFQQQETIADNFFGDQEPVMKQRSDFLNNNNNNTPMFKVLVRNLPWSAEWPQIKDFFAPVSHVVFAKVLKDRETGRSRGRAFVHFATEEDRQKALEQLNNSDFEGRTISMIAIDDDAPREPREQREPREPRAPRESVKGRQVFVGRIPRHIDEDTLRNHMEQVGTVQNVKIVKDRESGESRGFGFVCFASEEEANNALGELSELDGTTLFVQMDEKAF